MTRTDAFRPSVINAAEYDFVADHYYGNSEDAPWTELAEYQDQLDAHVARTGGKFADHKWAGRCDCCGAAYLYGASFWNRITNVYIRVGGTCGSKLGLRDPAAFKSFREQVNTWKIHHARVDAAKKIAAEKGIMAALDMYLGNLISEEFPERTIVSMMNNLVRWGNISDKQVEFAKKLLQQIVDRPRVLAEKAERDANRLPVPDVSGRTHVVGVMVSTKEVEDRFSYNGRTITKVLVESQLGYRVFGTLPSGAKFEKGRQVEFDAKLQRSDKDPVFGFFSRPTKWSAQS